MSLLFHRRSKKKKRFSLDKEAVRKIEAEFDDCGEFTEAEVYEEKPKHRRRRRIVFKLVLFCLLIMLINVGILLFTGRLWFNEPRKRDYPIRGPVVSESLGNVQWKRFSKQNIQMVYIRATKSTAYDDKNFEKNKKGVNGTELPAGALHIFDLSMDGKEQAEHFSKTAGKMSGWLIPAVEVKISDLYRAITVDYDKASVRLLEYVETIKEKYGVCPVIKCDKRTYENIASREEFEDCPIWYESRFSKPDESIDWDFWGYSNRVKFDYYESEDYLEMTLFNGSQEKFTDMFI